MAAILTEFARFRSAEVARLAADPTLTIGDATTINLTMLSGGVQVNVVPTSMRISFDIRLPVTVQHEDFERMVSWLLVEWFNTVASSFPVIKCGDGWRHVF